MRIQKGKSRAKAPSIPQVGVQALKTSGKFATHRFGTELSGHVGDPNLRSKQGSKHFGGSKSLGNKARPSFKIGGFF